MSRKDKRKAKFSVVKPVDPPPSRMIGTLDPLPAWDKGVLPDSSYRPRFVPDLAAFIEDAKRWVASHG